MTERADTDYGDVAADWWGALVPKEGGAKPALGWKRATLARLRRANRPLDVLMEPYALRLVQRLPASADRVALLAGVLAVVRKDVGDPITRTLGVDSSGEGKSAKLSESRFRRLLQTPTDELLDPMRRLVRLAQNEANVRHLAKSILYWGERTKKDWIFDYYGMRPNRSPSPTEPENTRNQTHKGDA